MHGTPFIRILALAGFTALLLSACSGDNDQTSQPPQPRFVKLAQVTAVPHFDEFTFPAVVSAVKTVDLSFEVSGRLVETHIVTGADIEQGHLLAAIDPKPFERRVEEQRTRLNQAKRELSRIETMFSQDLVAQSALDTAKTNFELAAIDLKNAEQDLSYTRLTAPFDAQVSQRLVENDSFVTAGTPITRLQDVSKIYFDINVPERLLTANLGRGIQQAQAALASKPDRWFPVEYVEHRTQPDPVSQTYQVVFAMAPVDSMPVTPGARAIVKVNLSGNPYPDGRVVPVTALVGDEASGFKVWHYKPDNGTVESVGVTVSHIEDDLVVILSSLDEGDQVVAAGASQMRPGLPVKPFQLER